MSYEQFKKECAEEIEKQGQDAEFQELSRQWIHKAQSLKYSYHFEWLGRPIIQYPQDIVAMQEIIWSIQPDLIIETGIAHGGSLIFSASMLELNAVCGGPADAEVIGVDVEIRQHNREAVEAHPMFRRISMIEGASTDLEIVRQIRNKAECKSRVLVCLDSNHTHDHVLAELEAYAPMVTLGSYCIVFDTFIEDMPGDLTDDRPWSIGNNPMTAVHHYLKNNSDFKIDETIDNKINITVAVNGYLKKVS